MTNCSFKKLLPAQPEQKAVDRFLYCVTLLTLNDFITDRERQKIHERMMKWRKREEERGNVS